LRSKIGLELGPHDGVVKLQQREPLVNSNGADRGPCIAWCHLNVLLQYSNGHVVVSVVLLGE